MHKLRSLNPDKITRSNSHSLILCQETCKDKGGSGGITSLLTFNLGTGWGEGSRYTLGGKGSCPIAHWRDVRVSVGVSEEIKIAYPF